jgi:hypothetical protein
LARVSQSLTPKIVVSDDLNLCRRAPKASFSRIDFALYFAALATRAFTRKSVTYSLGASAALAFHQRHRRCDCLHDIEVRRIQHQRIRRLHQRRIFALHVAPVALGDLGRKLR